MRIYPVLIDARPSYLGDGSGSLLLAPTGRGTVLNHIGGEILRHTNTPLVILTPFAPTPRYIEEIRNQGIEVEDVVDCAGFAAKVASYALSDTLLIRDSRRVSAEPLIADATWRKVAEEPMIVRHLVAPASTPAGTSERVLLDSEGRVSKIQRYYERVTWPFAAGVVCSIVPVASTSMIRDLPFESLAELRATLGASGVASRDTIVVPQAFDLARESGLLALAEHLTIARFRNSRPPWVASNAKVDPTAILRGPVVVMDGAEIGPRCVIIGPAVIGSWSRIGADSVVAHALVANQTDIPSLTVLRQRVASPGHVPEEALVEDEEAAAPGADAMPLEEVDEPNTSLRMWLFKAPVEIALCSVALLLLSPLLILVALLVKLDSRGPVLYGDRREGRFGRVFRCWKFRTMIQGADARQRLLAQKNSLDGPQFKMDSDPRVTRIGRLLRPLSLDELPQLLNVVNGDMSLVGPRPSPFRENQLCIPWREARLSVRPGITGLWQVCRHDRGDGDFHQWIYYDLLYVTHMSPWLDLKLLAATVFILAGRYSVPLSWMLPRSKFYDRRSGRGPTVTERRGHPAKSTEDLGEMPGSAA